MEDETTKPKQWDSPRRSQRRPEQQVEEMKQQSLSGRTLLNDLGIGRSSKRRERLPGSASRNTAVTFDLTNTGGEN